ncbi:hypothetical protein [Stenotrophomonas sp. PS02298]|uniref:helix-turn-helix domain-containing protein n=1 Tax=Stenotrophomonas sp. PS02298 TaxID=2991424 RepID=UPI00249AC82C|nr:hypothetical protein [Stenotrophomonas sp. PS02298]
MDALTLLEQTKERLRQHEGDYAEISRRTGVSYSSLVKLAQGHTGNPTVDSLQRVIDALDLFEGVPPRAAPSAATAEATPDQEEDPDQRRIVPVEEA